MIATYNCLVIVSCCLLHYYFVQNADLLTLTLTIGVMLTHAPAHECLLVVYLWVCIPNLMS